MGMASMPLPLPWRETAKLYEIPDTWPLVAARFAGLQLC